MSIIDYITACDVVHWMQSSKDEWNGHQGRFLKTIEKCEWISLEGSHPMMPIMAIEEAIKQLKLPKVDRISYNVHDLAPYGFYGIQAHYKNADVRAYFLDTGTHLKSICQEVWEKGGA